VFFAGPGVVGRGATADAQVREEQEAARRGQAAARVLVSACRPKGGKMGHSRIPDSELVTLVTRGHESKDVEYKGPMNWPRGDNKGCCELVKDILALANHGDGFLVIGVAEAQDGRLDPVGLDHEQLRSFETTEVNQFVNKYADPPINTTLRRLPHDGKDFVVIAVPGFSHTPHVCTKDYPGVLSAATFYIRTDNNESAPVSRAADLHSMIERALRHRADTLLEGFRAVLLGSRLERSPTAEEEFAEQVKQAEARFAQVDPYTDKGYQGYLETVLFPTLFDASRFTLEQLRAAANDAHVLHRGWSFLYTTDRTERMSVLGDALECSVVNLFAGHDAHDFWRLSKSGLLFHRRLMWEDAEGKAKSLSFVGLVYHLAEAVDALVRLYTSLGIPSDEEVTARFCVTDAKDRVVRSFDIDRVLREHCVSRAPAVGVERRAPLAEWRAGLRDHAVGMARDVLVQFNWPDPSPKVLHDIVDRLLDHRL